MRTTILAVMPYVSLRNTGGTSSKEATEVSNTINNLLSCLEVFTYIIMALCLISIILQEYSKHKR